MKFEKFKSMRFNLRFPDPRGSEDFVTIHSVNELQDRLLHRTIAFDDLIDYFRNGQLHRWLECLDAEEAERASNIKKLFEDSQGKCVSLDKCVADFAAPLLNALGMEVDEEVVNAFVFDYVTNPNMMRDDKKRARKDLDEHITKALEVIDVFRKHKAWLLDKKEDLKALRKHIAEMFKLYGGLSMLEEFRFIEFLRSECPLGALALLTLPEGQKYKDDFPEVFKRFVVVKILNNEPTIFLNENNDLKKMHPYLLSGNDAPVKVYRKKTKRTSGETIVQGGKNVLLLWDREYVVSDYGTSSEENQFNGDKLNGNFHVFNGLDVWSESVESYFSQPFLVYMEVPDNDE